MATKYSVPNAPSVSYLDQAEPDDFDYQALGNRRTGIFSGGELSALGTPGPSVQVAAGVAIIADLPVRFSAGTVGVANGGANPRFDILAVSKTGALANIPGAASANALFADFDFDNYAPLGAIYVPVGSTSVLGGHIAPKGLAMQRSFIRSYESAADTLVASDVQASLTSQFSILADGATSWGSSLLKRISNTAMGWTTSLLMKALGDAPILVLQNTSSTPATQRLLQTLGSGGGETAYINGDGQLYADNFKFGTGNPNGVVSGRLGDIFVSRDNGGTSLGIWQKGGVDDTTVGWSSYRRYDPTESSLPVGTVIQSLATTAPVGFIAATGQYISTTGATAALAAVIGSRYGAQAGQVRMPDLRGMTLAGAGLGISAFTNVGAAEVQLLVANLPPHKHNVNDPGHDHPQAGLHAYVMPWQYHNNRHILPSSGAYEHIYTEPWDFDRNSRTGITLGNTGQGTPVSTYQPTHTVNLYVKT